MNDRTFRPRLESLEAREVPTGFGGFAPQDWLSALTRLAPPYTSLSPVSHAGGSNMDFRLGASFGRFSAAMGTNGWQVCAGFPLNGLAQASSLSTTAMQPCWTSDGFRLQATETLVMPTGIPWLQIRGSGSLQPTTWSTWVGPQIGLGKNLSVYVQAGTGGHLPHQSHPTSSAGGAHIGYDDSRPRRTGGGADLSAAARDAHNAEVERQRLQKQYGY